jgi:hypothetical protein
LHAIALSMHVPWQLYWLGFVQTGRQLTPSQLTVPPVGAVHATPHDVAPQLLRSLVLTHLPPHRWNPVLHESEHVPLAWQLATPFASVGHFTQVAPHAVASSLAAHAAPQRWYPCEHVKSHAPVVHAVALAPVGLGHALHRVPHEFVLLSSTQTPPQSCVPPGQAAQGAFMAMQAPLQSIWFAGQVPPHF